MKARNINESIRQSVDASRDAVKFTRRSTRVVFFCSNAPSQLPSAIFSRPKRLFLSFDCHLLSFETLFSTSVHYLPIRPLPVPSIIFLRSVHISPFSSAIFPHSLRGCAASSAMFPRLDKRSTGTLTLKPSFTTII